MRRQWPIAIHRVKKFSRPQRKALPPTKDKRTKGTSESSARFFERRKGGKVTSFPLSVSPTFGWRQRFLNARDHQIGKLVVTFGREVDVERLLDFSRPHDGAFACGRRFTCGTRRQFQLLRLHVTAEVIHRNAKLLH